MGYSTTLYAVDLGVLAAAIGSRNPTLLEQLQAVNTPERGAATDTPSPDEVLRGDATLRVNKGGELFFNDQPGTVDHLAAALFNLESGSLELILEIPWTLTHGTVISSALELAPKSGLDRVISRFTTDDPFTAKSLEQSPRVAWSRPELREGNSDSHPGFSVPNDALTDLLQGNLKKRGSELGYALEVFCFVLGERLPDDDLIGELKPLKLKTTLEKSRPPLPLKRYRDFPVISHLTANEVAAESQRLSQINLVFPLDEDIEAGRHAFARCIQQAADKELAVVTFYR